MFQFHGSKPSKLQFKNGLKFAFHRENDTLKGTEANTRIDNTMAPNVTLIQIE